MPKIIILFFLWFLFSFWKGINDPVYYLFLYISLFFLNPAFRWWGAYIPDFRYAMIAGVLLVFSTLMQQNRYQFTNPFSFAPFRWYFCIFILILAVWPISFVPFEHQKVVILYGKYLCTFYCMVKIVDSFKKFHNLIFVFLSGQFYLGWVAWEVGRGSGGRLEGIGPAGALDANFAAASMVGAIPILFYYVLKKKGSYRVPYLLFSAFIVNALVLINSRGSFVGLIVSMGYYIARSFLSSAVKFNQKIIILLVTLVGLAGSVYLMDDVFIDRFLTLSDTSTEGSGSRMLIWGKGFDVAKDYPFGVGRRGFAYLSPAYLSKNLLAVGTGTRAIHNTFLQALTDLGYFGGIIFIVFMLSNWLYAERKIKWLQKYGMQDEIFMLMALESSFIGYLVSVVFINGLYTEMMYFLSAFIVIYGWLCVKKIQSENHAET